MNQTTETAILAGGCFWGVQQLIRNLPGVLRTRVGYTGGEVPNATYRNHGDHAEAIEVVFDPGVLSYRKLLEFFFQIHDPTTVNRQGNDLGASYRSAIFYQSDTQKETAEQTIRDVEASGGMARQDRHAGFPGRRLLGSGARTSGLSATSPSWVYLPLCSSGLEISQLRTYWTLRFLLRPACWYFSTNPKMGGITPICRTHQE